MGGQPTLSLPGDRVSSATSLGFGFGVCETGTMFGRAVRRTETTQLELQKVPATASAFPTIRQQLSRKYAITVFYSIFV